MSSTRVMREDFLRLLEEIKSGTSPKESIEQSTCFVIRNKYAYTFNEEVFCRKKTSFPDSWEFAVPLDPVISVLSKINDPEIEVTITDSEMQFTGKGRKTGIVLQKEIALPIDEIELPKKEDWKKLPEDFTDAVAIVESCASRKSDEFVGKCIHVHPKWIESTDVFQAARYKMKLDIDEPVLLSRECLEPVIGLDVIKYAVTEGWFHFKSRGGLLYSIKVNKDTFPDLSPLLKPEGQKTNLPKSLASAAGIAEIFSKEDKDNNYSLITLEPGRLIIRGEGTTGWHTERKKIKYDGKTMKFMMAPKIITQVIERSSEVWIADNRLIIDGGNWKYVTVLGRQKQKPEAKDV